MNRIKTLGKCKICHKEVTNQNGFIRFVNEPFIKLHYGVCEKKHDIILNSNVFSQILNNIRL